MSLQVAFVWGVFGGIATEALGVFKLRHDHPGSWPSFYHWLSYWAITGTFIVVGGVLAAAYSTAVNLNALLAIYIGASAPLLIGHLVSQTPPPGLGRVE